MNICKLYFFVAHRTCATLYDYAKIISVTHHTNIYPTNTFINSYNVKYFSEFLLIEKL